MTLRTLTVELPHRFSLLTTENQLEAISVSVLEKVRKMTMVTVGNVAKLLVLNV